MEGFIKLHRQFLEWEWFDDSNTFKLFIYCLLKANYTDKKYRGDIIKRGTFITSLESLSIGTKISVRSIRTSLNRLESTGEVTSVRTSKGTVIQIVKYDDYQTSDKRSDKQVTSKRQASDKQVTTTKKDKNNKKDKKYIPAYEEFKEYALSKKPKVDLVDLKLKYDSWVENDWKNGHDKQIINWKSTLLNTLAYIKESTSSYTIQQPKNLKDLYE